MFFPQHGPILEESLSKKITKKLHKTFKQNIFLRASIYLIAIFLGVDLGMEILIFLSEKALHINPELILNLITLLAFFGIALGIFGFGAFICWYFIKEIFKKS